MITLIAPTERFFVLPVGSDQVAMAYRMFDHWRNTVHFDCEHDSVLDCIEMYTHTSLGP